MQFDPVQLVQLGFHGTALAFLIVGFLLMKRVLGDDDDDEGGGQVDSEVLQIKLKNVRFFIGVSVLVMVLGIGAQFLANYLDSRHQVEVFLSPSGMPQGLPEPLLSTRAGSVQFDHGLGEMTVGRNLPIRLVLDDLVDRIEVLEAELRAHQTALAQEEGGGFDDGAG